jgi:hypothetical protein
MAVSSRYAPLLESSLRKRSSESSVRNSGNDEVGGAGMKFGVIVKRLLAYTSKSGRRKTCQAS